MWFIVCVRIVLSFVRFSAMRCSMTSGSFAGNLAMMYSASMLTYVTRMVAASIPRTMCFHKKTSTSTGSVTGGCGSLCTGSPATVGSLLWYRESTRRERSILSSSGYSAPFMRYRHRRPQSFASMSSTVCVTLRAAALWWLYSRTVCAPFCTRCMPRLPRT